MSEKLDSMERTAREMSAKNVGLTAQTKRLREANDALEAGLKRPMPKSLPPPKGGK
jgi:hypothetical protein